MELHQRKDTENEWWRIKKWMQWNIESEQHRRKDQRMVCNSWMLHIKVSLWDSHWNGILKRSSHKQYLWSSFRDHTLVIYITPIWNTSRDGSYSEYGRHNKIFFIILILFSNSFENTTNSIITHPTYSITKNIRNSFWNDLWWCAWKIGLWNPYRNVINDRDRDREQ